MRVFHITIGLNVGGAELMLQLLVKSHHRNTNYQHTVILLTDIGSLGRFNIDKDQMNFVSGAGSPIPDMKRGLYF